MNILAPIIIILLFYYVFTSFISLGQRTKDRMDKLVCFFFGGVFVLLAAFRGETVGADTYDYMSDYAYVDGMTFQDIRYVYEDYVGFYLLSRLFVAWRLPVWVWFGFIELLYLTSIYRLIFTASEDKVFSLILFVTMGHFLFSLAALKQIMATALVFHSFLDFTQRKYIRSLLFFILAYFVHPVVLIILLAYILYPLRKTRWFYLPALSITGFLAFGALSIMALIIDVMGNEHFEMYLEFDRSYSFATFFLYILMLGCSMFDYPSYVHKTSMGRFEFSCILIACAFQYVSSTSSPSIFRLGYIFSTFFLVFFPNVFSVRKNILSSLMKYAVLLGTITFFLYSNRNFVYAFQ